MALATGPGTETLHAHHFEDVSAATTQNLIVGVQHHIYTVLSIVCFASQVHATSNKLLIWIGGYDLRAGTTARDFYICQQPMAAGATFVWNDKFSFNGYEPVDQNANLTAAGQIAVHEQGSGVAQTLTMSTEHADTDIQVTVTYIDQNNA